MNPLYRNIGRVIAIGLMSLGIIGDDQVGHTGEVLTEGISIIMLLVIEIQSWVSKIKKR